MNMKVKAWRTEDCIFPSFVFTGLYVSDVIYWLLLINLLCWQPTRLIPNKYNANYLTFIPYNISLSKRRLVEGILAALYLCLKVDEHISCPHILSSYISSGGEISTLAVSWSKGKPCYLYHTVCYMPIFYFNAKLFCSASIRNIILLIMCITLYTFKPTCPIYKIRQNDHQHLSLFNTDDNGNNCTDTA